jgi:OHCU decarboxylase
VLLGPQASPLFPASASRFFNMNNRISAPLTSLNSLSDTGAQQQFLKCCGSRLWAEQMAAARPFGSVANLHAAADRIWWSLDSEAWLEAFRSHPKIGGKKAAAPTAATAQKWSEDEQSGVRGSAQQTLDELAQSNQAYEEKFAYIFIVCASGKSSEEMLAILRERLENDPDDELRIAAAEQAQITKLRLDKLLAG